MTDPSTPARDVPHPLVDLGLLDRGAVPATPEEWLKALPGAVTFRLPGADPHRTRAVVTLLHGNEPSGLRAMHRLLRESIQPAVTTLVVIGAVEAARRPPWFSHRYLPGGRDLNRCFSPPYEDDPDANLARRILTALRAVEPEAIVDLHNNSGHNPAYGVGFDVDPARLGLVSLFARRYIVSRFPLGTLVQELDGGPPMVTIECGRAGDPVADDIAASGLRKFLLAPTLAEVDDGVEVLSSPVRVELRRGVTLAFSDRPEPGAALTFDREVDRKNFQKLASGTKLGWVSPDADWPLTALDESGREVSRDYFRVRAGALETTRPMMPVMMTTDPHSARTDCLFYAVIPGPARTH